MTRAPTWTTRDGTVVKVKDMSDKHLLNTIRFLRRTAGRERESLACSMDAYSASTSAEMASWAAEREAERLFQMSDDEFLEEGCPVWEALLSEADRRGLLD